MRRLTIAAQKLVNTKKPITEIAYEAGYNSQQAFSLAFKQIYLYPPKTYRDIGVFVPRQNKISLNFRAYSGYVTYKVSVTYRISVRKIEVDAA